MDADPAREEIDAGGKKLLTLSILVGIGLGMLVGVPAYGLFSMGNVAMAGLGMIVTVAVAALAVAMLPSRGEAPPPK